MQHVAVSGGLSDIFPPKQGVLPGSWLGVLLFTVYMSKLPRLLDVISQVSIVTLMTLYCTWLSVLMPQMTLKLRIKPRVTVSQTLGTCTIKDRLLVNDDKTELLAVGTRQQLAKVDISCISVGSSIVRSQHTDSTLLMSTHIS